MPWIQLAIAGVLEVGWAIGLKYSAGFSRPLPTALTIAAMIGSMVLLASAVNSLPVGTAYAVWTGIGAVGTCILGIILFNESVSPLRLGFIALIVIGILGLKFVEGRA
ncbi:MAG: quaternary ammonium compound efflux SMR transporter SugE [bacterium]